uniref:CENP-V/GFA domain-containing protein n=1 Tax=Heterorhabditis bacteriophora TaxID=37862 RepID=A0A1I7XFI6_HETBA
MCFAWWVLNTGLNQIELVTRNNEVIIALFLANGTAEKSPFMQSEEVLHNGSCHCNAVQWTVQAPKILNCIRCNCSVCKKKSNDHFIVSRNKFNLIKASLNIIDYMEKSSKLAENCLDKYAYKHLIVKSIAQSPLKAVFEDASKDTCLAYPYGGYGMPYGGSGYPPYGGMGYVPYGGYPYYGYGYRPWGQRYSPLGGALKGALVGATFGALMGK